MMVLDQFQTAALTGNMLRFIGLAIVLTACLADEVAQPSAKPVPIRIYKDHQHQGSLRPLQNTDRLRHDMSIRRNPHSHLNDPYQPPNSNVNHGNIDQGYADYDNRNDFDYRRQNDDRRDEDDSPRNEEVYRRESEKRGEGRWWTDRDEIHHKDDKEDIEGPVILRHIKSHEHGKSRKVDIARQNKIVQDVYSPDYAPPTWVIDYRYLKTGGRDYTRGPGGQIIILPKGIKSHDPKDFENYDELIEHLRQKNLAERQKPQYFMPLGQEINHRRHDEKRDDAGWYN